MLACLATCHLYAVGVVFNSNISSIRVGAGAIPGTPSFEEKFIPSSPTSDSALVTATVTDGSGGYSAASLAYSFTNTATEATFSINTALSIGHAAGRSSSATATANLIFIPTEDLSYSISGYFRGTVGGVDYARQAAYLFNEGVTPWLFRESDGSTAPPTSFSFNANLATDGNIGAFTWAEGSLTGTLVAGSSYTFNLDNSLAKIHLATGSGEGVGAGVFTLRFASLPGTTPPNPVSDSGGTVGLLGLAILGLVAALRRAGGLNRSDR